MILEDQIADGHTLIGLYNRKTATDDLMKIPPARVGLA